MRFKKKCVNNFQRLHFFFHPNFASFHDKIIRKPAILLIHANVSCNATFHDSQSPQTNGGSMFENHAFPYSSAIKVATLCTLLLVIGCGVTSNTALYQPDKDSAPWKIKVELGRTSVQVFINDSLVVDGGTGMFGTRTELTGTYRGAKVLAIVNKPPSMMGDALRCDLLIDDKLVAQFQR